MSKDTIYRQDAIDIASGYCHPANIAEELRKLPSAQHKIAREDIEEYCRRRHMVLITGELYKEMTKRWSRPEIIYCKNCVNAEERGCALFCGFWTRYTAHKGYCFKAERLEK